MKEIDELDKWILKLRQINDMFNYAKLNSEQISRLNITHQRISDIAFACCFPPEKLIDLKNEPDLDSTYSKAIEYVKSTYVKDSQGLPAMLLGDVSKLIEITTGKEVDWNVLDKFRNNS